MGDPLGVFNMDADARAVLLALDNDVDLVTSLTDGGHRGRR